ncbi:FMN-binding protein MioC [Shewanella cyperi]|uniref:FMN-binding protein MioC n=1 Tax=Shewanella cyperi TaxID=2814292 RepID=A0A974XP30_9GAMM|nr:FMN-binding protein MioC [Shewanella cyperi]QSX31985.1 FMN-binding protein MioC [Shewanella cyperi]QSX42749.1 FMN-binding protein MioC [Shewanella cyperi]
MAKIEVLVGTTLGGSEYVADELMAKLTEAGHQCQTYLDPDLASLDEQALWLIVSSTHGAGDLPDNLQPFAKQLLLAMPDLGKVRFALCAIGDSSYDTFCQGPEQLIDLLTDAGASPFVDKIRIDVQSDPVPEEPALAWLDGWLAKL